MSETGGEMGSITMSIRKRDLFVQGVTVLALNRVELDQETVFGDIEREVNLSLRLCYDRHVHVHAHAVVLLTPHKICQNIQGNTVHKSLMVTAHAC